MQWPSRAPKKDCRRSRITCEAFARQDHEDVATVFAFELTVLQTVLRLTMNTENQVAQGFLDMGARKL